MLYSLRKLVLHYFRCFSELDSHLPFRIIQLSKELRASEQQRASDNERASDEDIDEEGSGM
jgi:hypothetical protein